MPDRYAVAATDASLPSTWDGGLSVPQFGDTVRPNGFVVPVTGTLVATTLLNAAGGGAVAGGSFDLRNGGTIQADLTWGNGTPLVTYAGSTSASIVGMIGNTGTGANTTNGLVAHTGSGHLQCVGGWQGGSGSYNRPYVGTGTGPVSLIGDANAGLGGYASNLIGAGVVSITGDVSGGGSGAYGLHGISGSAVTVTGSASSGVNGVAVYCTSRDVTLLGDMTVGTSSAVSCRALTWHGGLARSASGIMPFSATSLYISPTAQIEFVLTTSATPSAQRSLYTANHPDSGADMPAAANVRARITYDNGAMEGTCEVPAAAYTSQGVLVDHTVGTLAVADVPALTAAVAALGVSTASIDSTADALIAGMDTTALTAAVAAIGASTAALDSTSDSLITGMDTSALTAAVASVGAATTALDDRLVVLDPILPTVPAIAIPAPTQPTSTTAWCYCWDAHGKPAEGVEIRIMAQRGGRASNAYTQAAAVALSGADGIAAVEIPRDPTLHFVAKRGRGEAAAAFTGVDADTLELPAVLGRP